MVAPIVHWHLFSDEAGDTHLAKVDIALATVDFAPPAPPMGASEAIGATAYTWLRVPEDWQDTAHPSPSRQLLVMLSGKILVTVSDGTSATITAGDCMLLDDVGSRGHAAETVDGEATVLMVALSQN